MNDGHAVLLQRIASLERRCARLQHRVTTQRKRATLWMLRAEQAGVRVGKGRRGSR